MLLREVYIRTERDIIKRNEKQNRTPADKTPRGPPEYEERYGINNAGLRATSPSPLCPYPNNYDHPSPPPYEFELTLDSIKP